MNNFEGANLVRAIANDVGIRIRQFKQAKEIISSYEGNLAVSGLLKKSNNGLNVLKNINKYMRFPKSQKELSWAHEKLNPTYEFHGKSRLINITL